jgi:hypothetical protein
VRSQGEKDEADKAEAEAQQKKDEEAGRAQQANGNADAMSPGEKSETETPKRPMETQIEAKRQEALRRRTVVAAITNA